MAANPQADFVSSYRQHVQALITARTALLADYETLVTQGWLSNLGSSAFVGNNSDLSQADIVNAVTALQSIETSVFYAGSPPTPTAALAALLKL